MDPFSSALDQAEAIAKKEVSPVELLDMYLDRIDRLNPDLNAVTWRRDDEVRAEAKAAEDAVMRGDELGPFHGVSLPIKDLIAVEGWPITFGSNASLDFIAPFDSNTITAFKKAGFLLSCRTNTPEFGILPVTENEPWGATRNPWNLDHTPGGSSGGSGSAVAAGFGPVGHASDGGGSIRIPASCNGLVGLKCSRGRISAGPLVSDMMHGGATEGVVTHTVADTAAIVDLLSEPDPLSWYNARPLDRPLAQEVGASPGRLRIAYSTIAPTGAGVSDACRAAVDRTVAVLADLGHEIIETQPAWPEPEEVTTTFMAVWNTGTAYFPIEDDTKISALAKRMREMAGEVDSIQYVQALGAMQAACRQIVSSWGRDFDLFLSPTCAIEPPRVGALFENTGDDPLAPLIAGTPMAAFTAVVNMTGQPAISLPLHWSDAGLPVGVQIVGKPWGEGELIRIASQLEEAMPWKDRRPEFAA